jgi:predicted O-methyltransferase YrrM
LHHPHDASTFVPIAELYIVYFIAENDARCVEYTKRMIDFAGLSSKVEVILGSVSSSHSLFLKSGFKDMLISRHQCEHLDVLFIDHDKAQYLDDLMRIESCGLLSTGVKML